VVTVADALRCDGGRLLEAVTIGYDVTLELCDVISLGARGWDYVNLMGIGATCAVGRLLGLSRAELEEALSIATIPHLASDQVESKDLDAAGNLTMWKRFNGADAVRNAVYACELARSGARGALNPFTGIMGMFAMVGIEDGEKIVGVLRERLDPATTRHRACDTEYKRWPVGSRGQAAILAALRVRERLDHPWQIDKVTVHADPAVVNHLVREDAYAPRSRETADHSLPYIVAVALLDGRVDNDSFRRLRYEDATLRAFLADRVEVVADEELALGAAGGFPVRLEIARSDGGTETEQAAKAPGHRDNPLTDEQMTEKVVEPGERLLGLEQARDFAELLWRLDEVQDVREVTRRLIR
jgi:2-methylcitrate dehydratase